MLTKNGLKAFKAKFQKTTDKTVHGKEMNENEGRFFITKVLKDANKWGEFDVDRHQVGSAILWNTLSIMKMRYAVTDSSGTEATPPSKRDTKKRKRNPEKWKSAVKKQKLNSGEGYEFKNKKGEITSSKPKKAMKPPCEEKCRKKCTNDFSEEERQQIFDEFWKSGNIDLQRAFISAHVTVSDKARTRQRDECKTKRRVKEHSRSYQLTHPTTKETISVCQKFFLNTLSIDEKRVKTALAKKSVTGSIEPDMRGKHENHATSEIRQERVMEHIELFKVVESHYVRKDTKYQYLPDDLNITRMHQMYVQWCEEKNFVAENYAFYKRVFNEHFDLKFQKPKKDQCDKCTTYKNTPVEARSDEAIAEQEHHISEKKLAREHKEKMKQEACKSKTTLTAAFDLEKVLLAPHGQTSSFYYSRRLKNHNFTITDISNMETYCYLWSEEEASKGKFARMFLLVISISHKSFASNVKFYKVFS